MPLTSLKNITSEQFDSLATYVAREFDADLFLSSSGYPGYGASYLCWDPYNELISNRKVSKKKIGDFCFSDKNPTFGLFSYQFGQYLRGITITKQSQFPTVHLKKYKFVLSYFEGKLELLPSGYSEKIDLASIMNTITQNGYSPVSDFGINSNLMASMSREEYIDGVGRIIEYIKEGYAYQLNLSIKYKLLLPKIELPLLFMKLWSQNPASYYSLFRSGNYHIISTSPERFLKVVDSQVLSQPIKGTLAFDKFDKSLILKLTESPKEDAELSMIVDMIRNDISLNCEYGSVVVENHKSTFVVDNLIQMYSDVKGRLLEKSTVIDLLCDAFPGGSITGCPKKKAMELIDELEPHSRDVYCGSIFMIKDKSTIDSSIGIRTGYYNLENSEFCFFAGSGIVVESKPEEEYNETVAKAEKFLKIFGVNKEDK